MYYGSTKELVRANCGVLRVLNVVYQCVTCQWLRVLNVLRFNMGNCSCV